MLISVKMLTKYVIYNLCIRFGTYNVLTWYMGSGLKAQNMTGIRAQRNGIRDQKNGIRDHKAFKPDYYTV